MDDQHTRELRPKRTFDGATSVHRQPPREAQYAAPVEGGAGFAARYEDVALLGLGGMGEVRLCLDRRTERGVAVKRIDRQRRSPLQRARFLREARVQAQLDHPTVVPVYDIGVDDEGLEYFTMKRAAGVTLEAILDALRRGDPAACARFTLTARLGIFRQVCQGIEYAHARGIIHRDLKPANVMIGELGEVYVLDWGIAKVPPGEHVDARAASFTTARGVGLGTPGYLAPEQCLDAESVDERADVYSLGAMLFELLTLEPLHEGEEVEALIESTQLGKADARISVRRPDLQLAPELERACVLATRLAPAERLSSVAELHAIVRRHLDGDRDLALRREIAARHVEAARQAHDALFAGGDPDGSLRERALRDAGHALALDPQSQGAVDVITNLMAHPPRTIPAEAAAMLDQQGQADVAVASRVGVRIYLVFAALLLGSMSVVHVRDWLAVAAMLGPLVASIGLFVIRTRTRLRPPILLGMGGVLTSIAATSTLAGPYMIMPGLLATYSMSIASTIVPTAGWRRLWAGMCLFAVGVPMVLEVLHLLPVGFSVEQGRIIIEHRVSDASPLVMRVTLALVTLATVFTPMVFAFETARQFRETRKRLLVYVWHLRKLTLAGAS